MDSVPEDKLRLKRERKFSPHHVLLGAARMALENAESEKDGYFYHQLTALTFSALALEALANSFGARIIERWTDFESASPVAKLRVIARELKIEEGELMQNGILVWLVRFRNSVAHAKPEWVQVDKAVTRETLAKVRWDPPKSALESDISLENAKRAFAAVETVFRLLCDKTPEGNLDGLLFDGFSDTVSGS